MHGTPNSYQFIQFRIKNANVDEAKISQQKSNFPGQHRQFLKF